MGLFNIFKKDRAENKVVDFNKARDQQAFIGVMFITFISATIISAIINLAMFTQLSQEKWEKLLFLAISLTLEGTKVFTVIKAAILRSIGIKIEQARLAPTIKNRSGKKIPNKATIASRKFFALYLVFAFLAIFCSLGLSLSITSKSVASTNIDTQKMSLSIETAKSENEKYNKELTELNFDKIKNNYDKANDENDTYSLQLNTLNSKYRESEYKDGAIYNQILTVKATIKLLKLDEKKKLYENAIKKKEELDTKISANDKVISDAKLQLLGLEEKQAAVQGTSNMFALLANTFKVVDESLIRFILLMLVSTLIEITIYTATPDISISRKLLYYFRNQLPDGINVDRLLREFDKDMARFKGSSHVISINEPAEESIENPAEENIENPEDKEVEPVKAPETVNVLGIQMPKSPVQAPPVVKVEPPKQEPAKAPDIQVPRPAPAPVVKPEPVKVLEPVKIDPPKPVVQPAQEWPKPPVKVEQTKPIEDLKQELRNKPLLKSMANNPAFQELLASKGLANKPPAPTPAPAPKPMTKPAPVVIPPQPKLAEHDPMTKANFDKPLDLVEKKGYDKNSKGLDVKMLNDLIEEV